MLKKRASAPRQTEQSAAQPVPEEPAMPHRTRGRVLERKPPKRKGTKEREEEKEEKQQTPELSPEKQKAKTEVTEVSPDA